MKIYSYSQTRANFAAILNSVVDDCEPVVISRPGKGDAVIISRTDYESLRETAYLLSIPANARHLSASIAELEAG